MNSRVHFWVVCDAVDFIKNHGTELQQRALQNLQISYGEHRPVKDIPVGRTAVEYLAGFEAWHTDKFRDLAFELPALPVERKRSLTGFAGRVFTAFHHFINPYPQQEQAWTGSEGYSYDVSSKKGLDTLIMQGVSHHLGGRVDMANSPVLERLRPYWEREAQEWTDHFSQEVRHVRFAPWTALTSFYYSHLVSDHFEPLEVRGPNRHIVGLQLLGPVFHSIADACTIQHVRTTLGFGHPIWENYVQSRVYNREIELNPDLVTSFLLEKPFSPGLTRTEGPMKGCFDIEAFVQEMSVRTVRRLSSSTGRTWRQILEEDKSFWRNYLIDSRMIEDVRYLYNQAVAGTVHAIVRCHADLTALGILKPGIGLAEPGKMPRLALVQDNLRKLPEKRHAHGSVSVEDFRPDPFSDAKDLLGFEPAVETDLPALLSEARALFSAHGGLRKNGDRIGPVLGKVESSLVAQHDAMARRMGDDFCPLRHIEVLPVESDLSAHFGTATFRLPSSDECNDADLFHRYMELTAAHEVMAEKLQLTQAIASLTFYRARYSGQSEAAGEIDRVVEALNRLRSVGLDRAYQAAEVVVERSGETLQAESRSPDEPNHYGDRPEVSSAVRVGVAVFNFPLTAVRALAASGRRALTVMKEWTGSQMNVPVAALATVATVVLVVVMIYPRGSPHPVIGFSATQWKEPRLKMMGPKGAIPKSPRAGVAPKPRVAMIVQFQGFEQPVRQALVDSLYQALRPGPKWKREFRFVAPDKLKEALDAGAIKADTAHELIKGLKSSLDVSRVLLFTVEKTGDRFDVKADLRDLDTGALTTAAVQKQLPREQLPRAVRMSASDLLSQKAEKAPTTKQKQ